MTGSGILWEDWSPGELIREECMTAPTDGRLYRIDPRTRQVKKLDGGYRFTNGLAFDDKSRIGCGGVKQNLRDGSGIWSD